jgi:hypothetical protein
MDKIVPYLIPYKPIISLKFFDQDKASFLSNQILFSLKFVLNQKRHCACGPANGNGLAAAARPDPPPFRPMPHARWMTTPTIPFSREHPTTRPSAPLHSGELVEPVPGRWNPSSAPDFIQATPSIASTGESLLEPLHPRLAAPLLILYSSLRCRARRSRTPFLGAPPPPRSAATLGLLLRLHAAPPSR